MNSKQEIIEVSFDSSSESSGLNNLPPLRTFKPIPGYRTKEQARKKKHDVDASNKLPTPLPHVSDSSSFELKSNPSFVSSYHSEEDQPEIQGPSRGKRGMIFKETSSAPLQTQPTLKPPKQILGLPNQHVWNSINERGIHKVMSDFKGKGKRSME